MIRILLAVIDDLYTFARDSILAGVRLALPSARKARETYALPAREAYPALTPQEAIAESKNIEEDPESTDEDIEDDVPLTFRSTADILETDTALAQDAAPQKNTVMYTGGESTAVFRQPTTEFDGIVARVPYGSMVMVLEHRGRWAHIAHHTITGWVLYDELVQRAADVYPDFTIGEEHPADAPNTLRLRAVIEDEFGAGAADLSLRASEYVVYRLRRKGVRIPWPDIRPRTEGTWHTILRGKGSVHIDVTPLAGALMEYVYDDGEGHVAFVEFVADEDGTIRISEVNYPAGGIYNERMLTREEWRELKPVFISLG